MRCIAIVSFCLFLAIVSNAALEQCDPSKPETCAQGQHAKIRIGGGGEEPEREPKPGEDLGYSSVEEDGPLPDDFDPGAGDEIDVSDPSTHPKADGPDVDLSGDPVEVDLSEMGENNQTLGEKARADGIPDPDQHNKEQEDAEKADADEDPNANLDSEEKEMEAFGDIMIRLETITNEYLCTTSRIPLYKVDGDSDIFSMCAKIIAVSLQNNNQQFGAQIIEQWSSSRKEVNFTCESIRPFDEQLYDHPVNILHEAKELLTQWLDKKEVEASVIIDHFIPNFRSMFSRWITMRLMTYDDPSQKSGTDEEGFPLYSEEDTKKVTALPDEVGLRLLPLVKDEDSPRDSCSAGGSLYQLYVRPKEDTTLKTEINSLLDMCYKIGKTSDKPVEFANTLMSCDREEEARELFSLAVERGELCHQLQRPEQVHRKDLTARPVWDAKGVPELVKAAELGQKALTAGIFDNENLKFKENSQENMLVAGRLEVVQLYGGDDSSMIKKVCDELGEELCAQFTKLTDDILDSNDAYIFSCNETLSLDLWQLYPGAKTNSETGSANIVLQAFIPLEDNGHVMTIRAGEEVVLMEPNEPVLIDDTFENYMEVVDGGEPSNSNKPIKLLHLQICHPELHEKAMMMPSKKCAKAPSN